MDVRLLAANAILERGVRFRLPAPFWKRRLGKNVLTIRHLRAGTILEIARVVISSGLEDALAVGDFEFLSKAVEPCTRCVAIAVLNDKDAIATETERLTQTLLWKVSAESIVQLFMKVSAMNRVSDFTSITRFITTMTRTMMNPKNLGHETGGS